MTTTTELICAHRSIRKFTDRKLTATEIETLLDCARAASTSSFLQCTSIIRVTDPALREQLSQLSGQQAWVKEAAEFWVYCADFHRHQTICPQAELGFAELLLVGAIDTAIMAQNTLLAAESMGMGGVYIGGLRNQIEEVTRLLALPEQVLPLFGLCLGWPDETPEQKPRLPGAILLHENRYQPLDQAALADYDRTLAAYYRQRSTHQRDETWSHHIRQKLSSENRPFMLDYLHRQGWITR